MDDFFNKKYCDRCGCSFDGKARIMSMFNMDCICMDCKAKEENRSDYKKAKEAELKAVRSGNYNFPGIGLM